MLVVILAGCTLLLSPSSWFQSVFYFVLRVFALTIPTFFSGLSIFTLLCSFLALSAFSPIGVTLCADK